MTSSHIHIKNREYCYSEERSDEESRWCREKPRTKIALLVPTRGLDPSPAKKRRDQDDMVKRESVSLWTMQCIFEMPSTDFLKLAVCLIISFLFFPACQDNVKSPGLIVNPIDSTSSSYIAPKSFITGPNNTTIAVDSVTITWSGTQDVASFSYNVDGAGWSPFSGATSISLTDLDEGAHTFSVRAKHKSGSIESSPPSISFNVSAVTGPAIMFFPRRKNVVVYSAFTYSVQAEKIGTNLLAAKISLQVQPNLLQVDSVTAGDFVRQKGETPILFWAINSTKDTVTINVAAAGGAISGVNGSGALANLYCHARTTGLIMINFVTAQTAYRDTVGNAIPMNMVIPGKVVAQ